MVVRPRTPADGHHGVVDPAAVDLLLTAEGRQLLSSLPHPYDPQVSLSLTRSLREQGHSAELVAAALTQSELRTLARRKFGEEADRLLFTRDGLEQSSRPAVAQLHARRLADVGVRAVHDLGCGIGADSRAFARAGMRVTAVDSDAATSAVAAHNLADIAGGPAEVRVHHARAEDPRWLREARQGWRPHTRDGQLRGARHAVWLDPGRRTHGLADISGRTRRTHSPADMSPPWDVVETMALQWPAAGVKVGAGFDTSRLPDGVEAHWVSHHGDAVECVLWWGAAATDPGTTSAVVFSGQRWNRLQATAGPLDCPRVGTVHDIGTVLYELDPAVAAAGLRSQVALELGARLVGEGGYLTGDRACETLWARGWWVHEVLPLRPKALRAWARREDVGPLTVKRPARRAPGGQSLPDADALRRRIAPNGARPATILLSDIAPGHPAAALWVSPCPRGETAGP